MKETTSNSWENLEEQTVYFKSINFTQLAHDFVSLHSRVSDFIRKVGADTAGIELGNIMNELTEMKEYTAKHCLDKVEGTKVPVVGINLGEILQMHSKVDEITRSLETVGHYLPAEKKYLEEDLKGIQIFLKDVSNILYSHSQLKDRWDPDEDDD